MSHHFRPIRCVDGISQDKKCQESLVWHDLLLAIREGADVKGSVKKIILPVTAFHSPVFSRYFNAISPGLKVNFQNLITCFYSRFVEDYSCKEGLFSWKFESMISMAGQTLRRYTGLLSFKKYLIDFGRRSFINDF